MSKAKKFLAIFLTLIIASAVFAFPASAEEGTMSFQVKTDETSYLPGDSVTVNIYISSSFNATCIRVPVLYSKDIFEVASTGDVKLTAYGTCLEKKNSLDFNTDVSASPVDLSLVTTSYSPDEYGIVFIQWTASVTQANIASFQSDTAVKCFSFQLKVKSTANGTGSLIIPQSEELEPGSQFYNQEIKVATDATTLARVDAIFTVDDAWEITVDPGDADGITTKPGSDVIIDRENLIIKNWEDGIVKATIEANVMPTGQAELTFKSSPDSGAWGTGAKVRVWSKDNIMLEEYVILLYGDINADGSITSLDLSMLLRHLQDLSYISEDGDTILDIAADLDHSGELTSLDLSALLRYVQELSDINQAY